MKSTAMITTALILAVLVLAGCVAWPREQTEFIHVNSRAEALKIAQTWYDPSVGRTWSTVANTGSMRPILTGGEIILLDDYTGQPIRAGQIVSYFRDEGAPRVLHRVIEANERAAYIRGDNNLWPDSWIQRKEIKSVVARVVTFPR